MLVLLNSVRDLFSYWIIYFKNVSHSLSVRIKLTDTTWQCIPKIHILTLHISFCIKVPTLSIRHAQCKMTMYTYTPEKLCISVQQDTHTHHHLAVCCVINSKQNGFAIYYIVAFSFLIFMCCFNNIRLIVLCSRLHFDSKLVCIFFENINRIEFLYYLKHMYKWFVDVSS